MMELIGVRNLDHVYEIVERYVPAQRLTPKVSYFIQQVYGAYEKEQLSSEERSRADNRIEDQGSLDQNQNIPRGPRL